MKMTIRALIFDVFGTLVDWRTSIANASERHLSLLGLQTDWLEFADAWRKEYDPSMEKIRSGQRGFCKLDELHRHNLDLILNRWGWNQVDENTRQQLNKSWHHLQSWPEVGASLKQLRQQFLLAPCSNGHIELMVNLARYNHWHWDAILGAEIAQDYKPQAVVYQAAAKAFGLNFSETMMVAAHSSDLEAAARAGLKTAFIARPNEFGPRLGESTPATKVDFSADNLQDLADILAKTN
jgi:2-haloacid dehalogenase